MFIGGRGIVMNYPCAEFGDHFSFSRFGFIVQTDRQTQNDGHGSTLSRDYNVVLAQGHLKVI